MTTATNNDRSSCIQVSQLRTYNAMEKHFSISIICFDKCVMCHKSIKIRREQKSQDN